MAQSSAPPGRRLESLLDDFSNNGAAVVHFPGRGLALGAVGQAVATYGGGHRPPSQTSTASRHTSWTNPQRPTATIAGNLAVKKCASVTGLGLFERSNKLPGHTAGPAQMPAAPNGEIGTFPNSA